MKFRPACFLPILVLAPLPLVALDTNNNQQSDVWEMAWGASGLPAGGDADGDGFSNSTESVAGTNPLSALDFPALEVVPADGEFRFHWHGVAGKKYALLGSTNLAAGSWSGAAGDVTGSGGEDELLLAAGGFSRRFFKLSATDQDTDGDGFSDADERLVGFDPATNQTGRYAQLDGARLTAGLTAANVVTVSVYDDTAAERWAEPVLFTLRRSGGLQPLTVNFSLTGTATRGTDYTTITGTSVKFAAGQREVFLEAMPVVDADDGEPAETIILTALAGSGYTVSAQNAATGMLLNQTATSGPSAKEAARFLIQAAFGPDQDSDTDGDQTPENVEEVMALGFDAWLTAQFARPIGKLQPFVTWAEANEGPLQIYNDSKQDAWWNRAMGIPKLRPDDTATQLPDPLRQRIGFCLSQIFVISDRMEDLGVSPIGMANYYDMLLTHTFGNFRDLLLDVSLHPCMGMYLSHLGNQKANPAANRFPDENYAREIMQLFSIGLWELNQDGTRKLNAQNQPIATYTNADITELARVFTGLAFGGDNDSFGLHPRTFIAPMKAWDDEHDLAPKRLVGGTMTPEHTTASPGDVGTATMADVNLAVEHLFNHPNVGPFIGKLLIQRLVTSNPSPAYVGRVAAAFANNGNGVRGDMKAFIRAILMDPEARSAAMMHAPTFGKLREPFLRCVNLARAFNATTPSGWYYLDAFTLDHVQEPMKAPSVFNYFLPTYAPPGVLVEQGLVAPEFQIINASSGTTSPNYFWNAITGGLHRWGVGRADYNTTLTLTQEMLLNVPAAALNDPNPQVQPLDPDALLRRLDLVLTAGTLSPQQFQIIREALVRVGPNSIWEWPKSRLKLAIYLIVTSPDFCVLR